MVQLCPEAGVGAGRHFGRKLLGTGWLWTYLSLKDEYCYHTFVLRQLIM